MRDIREMRTSKRRLGIGALPALLVMILFFASIHSCGGTVLRSVTLIPEDGASDQPLNVSVNATFSNTVTDFMGSWGNYFMLKKDDAGDNLCTSFNVSGGVTAVQCVHDILDPNSSYTVTMNHPQADLTTATFTTAAN